MIEEIIANKEGSRRTLFEEASGISKYKLRKKQTLGKLKDTETDLSRVEDLLFEIEKNLKTLENQAKKAERYYKLKDQYKAGSLALAAFKISGFRDSLTKMEAEEQTQAAEKTGISIKIDQLEATLQQQKLNNLTKEKNLSTQQKSANEFISKIRAYESDKKLKNEQLRNLEDKKSRLTDELEKDTNQLNHIFYNQKRLNEEHFQEKDILERAISSLQAQKLEVDELRLQQQSSKNLLDSYTLESTEIQNQLYKLEKDLAILHIQKDALLQEGNRTLADAQIKETELGKFNKVLAELELKLQSQQNEYKLAIQFEEDLQQKMSAGIAFIAQQKDDLNRESRKLDTKQNEFNLTKSLVDNLEGFPESIRFLKKNTNWAKQAPLLSDVLFCKEEYRIAIENYLEPVMNHYVVETQMEAIQAIKLLSDSAKGRANFFILEAFNALAKKPELKTNHPNRIAALNIIDIDSKYRPLCEMLLHNVFVLQAGEEEELISPLPDERIVILSGSGKFSKTRIGMSGGSVGLFEGKRIGRAKNLENLSKEIKLVALLISRLKSAIDEENEKLISLRSSSKRQELLNAQQDINRLNNEFTSVKTRHEQYEAFIENSHTRKQDIELKISSIADEILLAEPRLSELKTQKQIKNDQVVNFQLVYQELAEQVNERSNEYNEINIRFHQQQNKVAGIEKDLEYRQSQQEHLEKRMAVNRADLDKILLHINETLKHADHSDEDLITMYVQKSELEKGLQELEQEYYAHRGVISETENEITLLRRKKDNAELISNELKDHKTNLKLDLNALKERLSIEFSVDISDLLNEENPEEYLRESEEELRIKTERIKKQMDDFGAINPMAMEAYREINERYNFIQAQKKDLIDAKTSLLQTIKEIDDTAKEKFMDAFVKVRESFIEVFRSLFNEEDSCDLVLSNPESPLDSDIEILARPKGKRPLSINQLSGGEKTLTATALLFALYLLKPAPFCIFDEVDAPLDDSNIDKFNTIIRKFSDRSQFIVVSHNKRTIASTDIIYGVTMVEQGVSRVVAVDLREVA